MYKIGVIGDAESVLGFAALGFHIFEAQTVDQAALALKNASELGMGVIFITEELAVEMDDIMEEYRNIPVPALIPIPGKKGSMGVGIRNLKKSVERAVGADILFND